MWREASIQTILKYYFIPNAILLSGPMIITTSGLSTISMGTSSRVWMQQRYSQQVFTANTSPMSKYKTTMTHNVAAEINMSQSNPIFLKNKFL